MKRTETTGAWGELLAANYLRKKKYRILDMNFSCRLGEIDIIAENGEFLVFAEVKLRKDDTHGQAREFVTAQKQQRLRKAALMYLSQMQEAGADADDLQPRFDVIEIYAPLGKKTRKPEIFHLEDAF